MLNNQNSYKYVALYNGHFVITQCFTNITVNLQWGEIQIKYNIRCIKPYKSNTKVEDYTSIHMYDTVSIYFNSPILLY